MYFLFENFICLVYLMFSHVNYIVIVHYSIAFYLFWKFSWMNEVS